MEIVETTATVSHRNVFFRRFLFAILFSALSHVFVFYVFILIINGNLMHPVEWVKTIYIAIVTPLSWLYIFPHIFIIAALCLICGRSYIMGQKFSSSQLRRLFLMFSIQNVIFLFLHVLVGSIQVWMVLSICGKISRNLSSEELSFLRSGGLWIGLYTFGKTLMSSHSLSFPVIYQEKLIQFKDMLPNILKQSLKNSLWPSLYFTVFHFICNLFANNLSKPVYIFYTQTYICNWIFAVLFLLNLNLIKAIFNIILTEPLKFSICKIHKDSLTLQDCINLNEIPIIQNLACQDLFLLASLSTQRKKLMFELSQPGDQPHNWNHLVNALIKQFQFYLDVLGKSAEGSETCTSLKQNPLIEESSKKQHLRNMVVPPSSPIPIETTTSAHNFCTKIILFKTNILTLLKTFLGIYHFYGDIPEASVQHCLSHDNVIIWCSFGVSELICASLTEDGYGVVQRDLPTIMTILVNMSQAFDKLNKSPALSKSTVSSDNCYFKSKTMISSYLKISLSNICVTFKDYLHEIPLSEEVLDYLQSTIIV